MEFNRHPKLEGTHAPFSPSQSAWLRYDDEKLSRVYRKKQAASLGTKLHAWAAETIKLKIKQPKSKNTLSAYVNDAIGYRMSVEVLLCYSEYIYGTADAICFRDGILRIHDLKTGEEPASMEQLEIYAAIFCLEYKIKPGEIKIELRIYQNNEVLYHEPTAEDILPIMDKIVHTDKVLERMDYMGD
jgi:hypothetical protein